MRKVQLIIRKAGERTAEWCTQYHHRLFPQYPCMPFGDPQLTSHENILQLVHCMSETPGPFLLIDADIFITQPDHLIHLLETKIDEKHHMKSMLHCRFMGRVYRGVLLFSEVFARKMKEVVAQTDLASHPDFILRPFRAIIDKSFSALQLDSSQDADPEVVGIHDFFQYRQHIFHKMVNRSWRLSTSERAELQKKLIGSSDLDDRVAEAGLKYGSELSPRKISYQDLSQHFEKLNREEKEPTLQKSELSQFPKKSFFGKDRCFELFRQVTSTEELE